jgi:hypothetical protein
MIPMVMTHGDAFRRDRRLLPRLVDAGLTEISLHVDTTQRGRDGYRAAASEIDLMPLRDELAGMIRAVRRETGTRLRGAMTVTVTRDNVRHVADVTRWVIRNHDAISLVSYQPAARVGRTRTGVEGVSPAELWREIARATAEFGASIEGPRPLDFGHPACSHYTPFVAVTRRGDTSPRLLQTIRDTPGDVALLEEYLSLRSIGMTFRDDSLSEMLARAAGAIRLEPRWFLSRARRWVDGRLRESLGTTLLPLLLDAILGRTRLRSVTIASHHFMSADELATPTGAERLAACVFRVPVDGRMMSMCEVNALGARGRVYEEIASGAATGRAAGG